MKALLFSVSVPQFAALQVLGRLSRRWYYDSPLATVRLVEVPEPGLPSPDWVKIRTVICGLCGTDVNLVFLRDSPTATPFTSFPCIIGHEICGTVVEIGERVKGVHPGDTVTIAPTLSCNTRNIEPPCDSCRDGRPASCENLARGCLSPGMITGLCRDVGGGFAPYLVAHNEQVFRIPAGIPPQAAVLIEPLAVAVQAVLDSLPRPEDKVLIIGGGVIGNLIVKAIRAVGIPCQITVAEPSAFHGALAREGGADRLVSAANLLGDAESITGGTAYKPMIGPEILMGGFSSVFDTVGSTNTLNQSLRVLKAGGTLNLVGISKDTMTDLTPLWLKLQTIKGVFCYGYANWQNQRRHAFEIAIDLIREKKVDLQTMVTHTFALQDYKRMIEVNLNKGKYQAVKTAVSFADAEPSN